MKLLITGTAGFIGFHLAKRLLDEGHKIVGIDNLNDYYDVSLKEARLAHLGVNFSLHLGDAVEARGGVEPICSSSHQFTFIKMDISDREAVGRLFAEHKFDRVFHMAAQAGVRYSLKNPHAYIQSNVVGFMNILEGCRKQVSAQNSNVKGDETDIPSPLRGEGEEGGSFHLIYASSSSVYGLNTKMPFSVKDNVDCPVSLYAATKRANELMAHTYSYLYRIPTTGLRFFTVYGPWGRPDMALFKFTRSILAGEPIDVYNEGHMRRDFTYIDDIIEGVVRAADKVPSMYALYNIGNGNPVDLMDFINVIECALGVKARINYLPAQAGDIPETYADVSDLERDVGYRPSTDIQTGVKKFIEWYRTYYKS